MSDKPTCKTCPYLMRTDAPVWDGYCCRRAPRSHPADPENHGAVDSHEGWHRSDSACVSVDNFCGEHPAFPAWLDEHAPAAAQPSGEVVNDLCNEVREIREERDAAQAEAKRLRDFIAGHLINVGACLAVCNDNVDPSGDMRIVLARFNNAIQEALALDDDGRADALRGR